MTLTGFALLLIVMGIFGYIRFNYQFRQTAKSAFVDSILICHANLDHSSGLIVEGTDGRFYFICTYAGGEDGDPGAVIGRLKVDHNDRLATYRGYSFRVLEMQARYFDWYHNVNFSANPWSIHSYLWDNIMKYEEDNDMTIKEITPLTEETVWDP